MPLPLLLSLPLLLQVLHGNAINDRGAQCLVKALTGLTYLDLTGCPIGRRTQRQLGHLLAPADTHTLQALASRYL
jgi:hypothetical protein